MVPVTNPPEYPSSCKQAKKPGRIVCCLRLQRDGKSSRGRNKQHGGDSSFAGKIRSISREECQYLGSHVFVEEIDAGSV